MKRELLRSTNFIRDLRRCLKRVPDCRENLLQIFQKLSDDAFHPMLRTHKLKGNLLGSWACSAGYDLRIVFDIVIWQEMEAIQMQAIGKHEEVY